MRAGIYECFDAVGRRLNIVAEGRDTRITVAEQQPSGASELRTRLYRYFEETQTPGVPHNASLDDLVTFAYQRLGMD